MRFSKSIIATLLIVGATFFAVPMAAQNFVLPDDVDQVFKSLAGSWEGKAAITSSLGAEVNIPFTIEYKYILKNTTIHGTGELTVGGGEVIEMLDIFAWDPEKKVVAEFTVTTSGEMYYSEGMIKDEGPGILEVTLVKETEKGTMTATSILSFPDKDTMVWDMDMKMDGKDALTQKITLHRK